MTFAQTLFQKNPDLQKFCIDSGIENQIIDLINQNTLESKQQATDLILNNNFKSKLANEIYAQHERTAIIGNGDVMNREQGVLRAVETGVDGIMIGRGIFHNPWAFVPLEISEKLNTKENRLVMLLEHLEQWKLIWEDQKHFPAMKKFVKMYVSDFPEAKELRSELMEMTSADPMIERIKEALQG